MFISLWNRPLFTVIFAIPVQFGKYSIPILMCLITGLSTFMLYLALYKQQIKNAFLILPLVLFQTYFFGISRNAETEPLAVSLFCLGYYFMVKKKWGWFALMGGLLPLARLELCLLFPFWAIILLRVKAYKEILLLGAPLLSWNIAAGFITGDFAYVFTETIGKDNSSNRYGHTTFGHYFQRYIYVVGPIFFFFFTFGIWKALASKLRTNGFVFLQFIAGFIIYVLFSWKLNMGNSAGFMRHITPVSALAAIIALWGFNYWWQLISKPEPLAIPEALESPEKLTETALNELSRKKKKKYLSEQKKQAEALQKLQAKAEKEQSKAKKRAVIRFVVLGAVCGLLILLAYQFFSLKMYNHQSLKDLEDYAINRWTLLALTGVTILLLLIQLKKVIPNALVAFCVGSAMLALTALVEPPNANQSIERKMMDKVSNHFQNSYFNERTIYVNHIWFFWANDLDRYAETYKGVTMANLDSADNGSICIWESHYSHRLAGDVQPAYFGQHPEWVQLSYYTADSTRFRCNIYQKIDLKANEGISAFERFIDATPVRSANYVSLGNYYLNYKKQPDSAIAAYNEALMIDSTDVLAHFSKGVAYYGQRKWEQAAEQFLVCTVSHPKWSDGWVNLGSTYGNLKRLEEGVEAFSTAISLNDKNVRAYTNRGSLYQALKDTSAAITDFSNAIQLNKNNKTAYLRRGALFFGRNYLDDAIKDFTNVTRIDPNYSEGWRLLGVTYLKLGKKEEAEKALKNAEKLGNASATRFLEIYF